MQNKKIYTATYHSKINYGQFLQAYALQQTLENSQLINFHPFFTYNVGVEGRKKLPFLWPIIAYIRYLKMNKKRFAENSRLKFTKIFRFIRELRFFEQERNVTLIAGSDQIWNESPILKDFFFLNFGNSSAKRISYAASLGVKRWSRDFENLVLPLLKRFNAISVREESAVLYLTSLGLKNVACVCDPTILHTGDFYREKFPYERKESSFAFVYRIRERVPESVKNLLGDDVCEIDLQKKKGIVSVAQWLQNIDNSRFVVTDSFHCAVFCILFHKRFLVLPNRSAGKGMNERFVTLLGRTNLAYRCLTCEESPDAVLSKLYTPMDWMKIDLSLAEWRACSSNWLKNALDGM